MTKLNANICAQVERAAQLLRAVATTTMGNKLPKRPDLQEFVDTAASLEAIVKRSRRNALATLAADSRRGRDLPK